MIKSLDAKIAEIRANSNSRAFIIADAKDADMAFGVQAPGPRSYLPRSGAHPANFSPEIWTREEFGHRNMPEYLEIIREVVGRGEVDILLMSAYVNEQLSIKEKLFRDSLVTPAARANDTSDIWAVRNGSYITEPSRPFRSATIDHIQCGRLECERDGAEFPGANLGLYSMTFVNRLDEDERTLKAFKAFREEAEAKKFRYFLEVFNPNVESGVAPEKLGQFVNDHIVRTLAGVTDAGRPLFLKIVYQGPRHLEELVQFDPNLIVGILGGGAGTTFDAFNLIHQAQKHGARVALFGRKINNAEHQIAFISILRLITNGEVTPEEAVRAYHGILQRLKITPKLPLEQDLELTDQSMSYGGGSRSRITVPARVPSSPASKKPTGTQSKPVGGSNGNGSLPRRPDGGIDFSNMTSEQRLDYHRTRLQGRFG